jgi:hypothetical protein
MAHIRLKPIVEQIQHESSVQEAEIHPNESFINRVEQVVIKHLDSGKLNVPSYLSNLWGAIKKQFAKMFLDDELHAAFDTKKTEWDDLFWEIQALNTDLERYNVSFNIYMEPTTLGGITPSGLILLNPKMLFAAKKENGKWNLQQIKQTLGHELIHRGQYERGMGRHASRKKQAAGDSPEYFNDYAEVMAWGYTLAKTISYENQSYDNFIERVRTSEALKEFLKSYTRENRQKVVRHILAYGKRALDRK